tara:strand:- start:2918 stop:3322 length:405 start_codon:yes stop_codon:yes gene_type:complete
MGKLAFILSVVFLLSACSGDDGVDPIPNGSYSGIFTVEYLDGTSYSNPVTVHFSNKKDYSCSRNTDDFYPSGGSGTYKTDGSKIVFWDINLWTADFDWNLFLNGEYNFLKNGSELIISAERNNIGLYRYELEKD